MLQKKKKHIMSLCVIMQHATVRHKEIRSKALLWRVVTEWIVSHRQMVRWKCEDNVNSNIVDAAVV